MRRELALRWIAIASALLLLLASVMPNWFARTSWTSGARHSFTTIIDSPAGYVGLVSLCGFVAFVALAVALWRRWAVAAVLAAAAFSYGAYVAGSYWLGLSRGVALLEGRADSNKNSPEYTVHWPPMLPFFVFAAVVGVLVSLALAATWLARSRSRLVTESPPSFSASKRENADL